MYIYIYNKTCFDYTLDAEQPVFLDQYQQEAQGQVLTSGQYFRGNSLDIYKTFTQRYFSNLLMDLEYQRKGRNHLASGED